VDALSNGYFTPLLACISHGCEDAARALLAAGADVHLRSPKWGSYLHAAAKYGKTHMVRMLLGFDADLSAEDADGLTPLMLAEKRDHTEAAGVLRKAADRRARLEAKVAEAAGGGGGTSALVAAMAEAAEAAEAAAAIEAAEAEAALARGEAAGANAGRPPTEEEEAAAAAAAQKKAQKRARQKARDKERKAAEEAEMAKAVEREEKKLAADASPPPSQTERRADALLAERALAELSVEAAKKMARSAAVESVAAAHRQAEASGKLRALAGEMVKAVAVEGIAAAHRQDEASDKLRALAGGAARNQAMAEYRSEELQTIAQAQDVD
jgi:hypothetical protein